MPFHGDFCIHSIPTSNSAPQRPGPSSSGRTSARPCSGCIDARPPSTRSWSSPTTKSVVVKFGGAEARVLAGSLWIDLHELKSGVNFTEDQMIEALDRSRR